MPAAHEIGVAAPAAQYPPSGHASHAVAPYSVWYAPAAEGVQATAPSSELNEPGAHAAGATAPVEHACPTVHSAQSAAAVLDEALE